MAGKSKRGFAAMDPDQQKKIASQGGRAAHRKGTAHEFTSEEARIAGSKGGQAGGRSRKRKNFETSTSAESQGSLTSGQRATDWLSESDKRDI